MNLELFEAEDQLNILPYDGVVQDYGLILDMQQSQKYLQYFLHHLPWQPDEVIVYGQYFQTKRKLVWYADELAQYHYSGISKPAHLWNAGLFRLKQHIEQLTGHSFNCCLANLYEDGTQAMGWHSDDEAAFKSKTGLETVIASLSLGAPRKFRFRHKTTLAKVDVILSSGQLIVMRGATQCNWKHALAKSMRITEARINLTFRYIF